MVWRGLIDSHAGFDTGKKVRTHQSYGDKIIYYFECFDEITSQSSPPMWEQLEPAQVIGVGQASQFGEAPDDYFLHLLDDVNVSYAIWLPSLNAILEWWMNQHGIDWAEIVHMLLS